MKELALHIMDIVQNSIVANANQINITVNEDADDDLMHIIISDNGKGIPADVLSRVTDPYTTSRTTRKVGMGIPLLKDACEISGGELQIHSEVGKGTTLTATLGLNHIDRQPLGDIAGVVTLLVTANPTIDFTYTHRRGDSNFLFCTKEVKEVLEGVPLNTPEVGKMLREMITSNLEEL